jgi:hypothetical protein
MRHYPVALQQVHETQGRMLFATGAGFVTTMLLFGGNLIGLVPA